MVTSLMSRSSTREPSSLVLFPLTPLRRQPKVWREMGLNFVVSPSMFHTLDQENPEKEVKEVARLATNAKKRVTLQENVQVLRRW